MVAEYPYKDIHQAIRGVRIQIIDSIPYASRNVPKFSNPAELWDYLKPRVKYKNDKRGYEQLQTMQTLFNSQKNVHGIKGAGDCDCFTIAAVACMLAQGWRGVRVLICGRAKSHPVHIYAVIYWRGKRIVFDLTNSRYNFERKGYKYYQEIPVKLGKK